MYSTESCTYNMEDVVPSGNKPLPELMLTNIQVAIWYNNTTMIHLQMNSAILNPWLSYKLNYKTNAISGNQSYAVWYVSTGSGTGNSLVYRLVHH